MKFIRDLIRRNRDTTPTIPADDMDPLEKSYRETIGSLTDEAALRQRTGLRLTDADDGQGKSGRPQVNIWDLEQDDEATALPGFARSDGESADMLSDTAQSAPAQQVRFPVGWVVVADGPGRGESFALLAGMSQIGRGGDQAIPLDFGDIAISRNNHAAIVYDPESHLFWLGQGGKSNIVRLNDRPVISTEPLKSGDVIRIGETTLWFVALCDSRFNWASGKDAEDDDVAIA
ncbi:MULTISPECIES: FHA domain-containing protein [unclassified Yoonia]|uniref:FHA domain-containing protein n=1 Tax=unclassified Yoonia TaxID=2629118 RepID=UPI002AFF3257|nr:MULTISPECIES: FHA domain-containing protein [unclassified Yoonia]